MTTPTPTTGALKKKQRIGSNPHLSTLTTVDSSTSSPPINGGFNDPTTADVILRLLLDSPTSSQSETQIYLHSTALRRSKYFDALLSDRWQHLHFLNADAAEASDNNKNNKWFSLSHTVSSTYNTVDHHLTVLNLLYSNDLTSSLENVSTTLNLLPIALEFLFEDLITASVTFLESVPWTESEESKIINLIPLLSETEQNELLPRISPSKTSSSEEMLHGLIVSAIHNHPNMAFAKAFVAKLLREFSSKESARIVLDKAFEKSLKVVRLSLEEYSSPDFRGDHNETEAIQRLNLHKAMTNLKHLVWLVERMIELRVADNAVRVWSEQASFTGDLVRAFRDDAWRNIVPSLPAVVLRCTCRLAGAVASGSILAARQVRIKLVRDWLPVLIICKDSGPLLGANHKSLYVELEETFLRIISTLPMSDAQDLLQQCLSFSTRNVDDCPHLVDAFTTWFRRANRPPQADLCE